MTLGSEDTDIEGASANIEQVSLTDPTMLYAFGTNGNLREAYDPGDYADTFAAATAALADLPSGEQGTLILPYTGSTAETVNNQLAVPSGEPMPYIYGHGFEASRFNYAPTDGSPAVVYDNPGFGRGAEWLGWSVIGPGSGAAGGGNGVEIGSAATHSLAHNQRIGINVRQFPNHGMKVFGFFTGRIEGCTLRDNGSDGLWIDRLNGGSIRACRFSSNGARGIYARDSVGGYIGPGNVIDAGGAAGTVGIEVEATNKRVAPYVLGNYLEDNETHIKFANGALPNRGGAVVFNRMQTGTTGFHAAGNTTPNNYGTPVMFNHFQNLSSEDILADGTNYVYGPNGHESSTTKFVDNAGGDYAEVSQSVGTYSW